MASYYSLTQYIPHLDVGRALKVVIFLLFLVNARSWPLAWHCTFMFLTTETHKITLVLIDKVLVEPIVAIRARYRFHRLSTLFLPAHVREERRAEWLRKLGPVGQNPFTFEIIQNGWVGTWCLSYPYASRSTIPLTKLSCVAVCNVRLHPPYDILL